MQRITRISYPEGGHAVCREVEDSSFWFAHRNRCIVAAVERMPPCGPILDIGGGGRLRFGTSILAVARKRFDPSTER